MKKIVYLLLLSMSSLLVSCGNDQPEVKFVKSPIDNIITKYIDIPNYSVILADMDHKTTEDKYFHKYKIILEKDLPQLTEAQRNDSLAQPEEIEIVNTDWKEVSPIIFEDYIDDLGMTILSKKNGVLDKNSSPAGMNNYVGNPHYGRWRTHNGSSFWEFYGRYSLMRDLFYGPRYGYGGYWGYPRHDWDDYRRNYRGQTSYYGKAKQYGTGGGSYSGSSSQWRKKPSSFQSKVRSKVSRSAGALKSRGYHSRKSYTKTYRNTSRYSSSSSYRGRSGGYGK